MLNHTHDRKLVELKNGREVMIRLPNGRDRNSLIKFFQEAPPEEIQFCKEDVQDPQVIDGWLNPATSQGIMSLIGTEVATDRILASLNLSKGWQAACNVGEIQQVLVAKPLQGLGLGSRMLDELIDLAAGASLHWLKVEIAVDQKNIVKAFQSKGFEIWAILDDYFIDSRGGTHDVALMLRPLINKDEDNF